MRASGCFAVWRDYSKQESCVGFGGQRMSRKGFWVYIVASRKNGTIYTGHTDDLAERIWQHQTKAIPGFTAKYGCDQLVWCERFDTREQAFLRERQIKEWRRAWKTQLIEERNPDWNDLSETMNMWL
jgi:putative endonuclease